MKRSMVKTLAKTVVSILLMGVLIYKIDARVLWNVFSQTELVIFGLTVVLFLFQQSIVAYCWHILLCSQQNSLGFVKTLKTHFIGGFFGALLPSSIGTEVIRAYSLSRHLPRGVEAASSIFVARIVGFSVNFLLAFVGALQVGMTTGDFRFLWLTLVLTAFLIFIIWLMVHQKIMPSVVGFLERAGMRRFAHKMQQLPVSTLTLLQSRRVMAKIVLLSVFFQVLGIIVVVLLGASLHIELSAWRYFVYVPLIMAISILPISVAGIGVRDGAFVFFFAQSGVLAAQALSLSILLFAQWLLIVLLGGLWYALEAVSQRSSAALGSLESSVAENR